MENQPPQPPFMKGFGYTVLGNLGLLIAYSIILRVAVESHNGNFSFGVLVASCIQAVACLFTAIGCFFGGRSDLGAGFLLAAFLIPLIGFSICLVGFEGRLN